MGGTGSGRRQHYSAKDTVEDNRALDVRRWKRAGFLAPGRVFTLQWSRQGVVAASINVSVGTGWLTLSYRHKGGGVSDWKDESYSVQLVTTPCPMGGERPWFLCPARGCGKRVALLYGGGLFLCRHCHQLTYPSQREGVADRYARKADHIRDRLGWHPGFLNPAEPKPKGMHWKTYDRLRAEHNAFGMKAMAAINAQFGWT